jgi:hypothetical protein
MRNSIAALTALALAGCASKAVDVAPTYVSPMQPRLSVCPPQRALRLERRTAKPRRMQWRPRLQ